MIKDLGEAEDAVGACGGLLVARGNCSSILETLSDLLDDPASILTLVVLITVGWFSRRVLKWLALCVIAFAAAFGFGWPLMDRL